MTGTMLFTFRVSMRMLGHRMYFASLGPAASDRLSGGTGSHLVDIKSTEVVHSLLGYALEDVHITTGSRSKILTNCVIGQI